jgi:histone chaperone ASF1
VSDDDEDDLDEEEGGDGDDDVEMGDDTEPKDDAAKVRKHGVLAVIK